MQLSTTDVDFQHIREQLQLELARHPVWKDLLVGAVGQTLMDMFAGVGAVNQYAIERGVQDCFMETANDPKAILTLARTLGARISRRRGAVVRVNLTRGSSDPDTYSEALTIPAYTQFAIEENFFVNDHAVTFAAKSNELTVDLREGYEDIITFKSNGSHFQSFCLGTDFECDDQLLRVVVKPTSVSEAEYSRIWEWERVEDNLWNYNGSFKVFQDLTTQFGEVEIKFGNNVNGAIPPAGQIIYVYIYKVKGTLANDDRTLLPVTIVNEGFNNVSGVTDTPITGGDDPIPYQDYRYLAPRLFAAQKRAVTRDDHHALILTYPDVVDCRVIGEYEGAQNAAKPELWRNLVVIYLLTKSNWNADNGIKKLKFLEWYNGVCMMNIRSELRDLRAYTIDVYVTIIVDRTFKLETVRNSVISAIESFFAPKKGHIGQNFYYADLATVVGTVSGVLHSTFNYPTDDQVMLPDMYTRLGMCDVIAEYQ